MYCGLLFLFSHRYQMILGDLLVFLIQSSTNFYNTLRNDLPTREWVKYLLGVIRQIPISRLIRKSDSNPRSDFGLGRGCMLWVLLSLYELQNALLTTWQVRVVSRDVQQDWSSCIDLPHSICDTFDSSLTELHLTNLWLEPPLPPLGHIWDVMMVWTKGNLEKTICTTVLCIFMWRDSNLTMALY